MTMQTEINYLQLRDLKDELGNHNQEEDIRKEITYITKKMMELCDICQSLNTETNKLEHQIP